MHNRNDNEFAIIEEKMTIEERARLAEKKAGNLDERVRNDDRKQYRPGEEEADKDIPTKIEALVERGKFALQYMVKFDQEQVNKIVKEMAMA
ncbi:MAG: hypothetical protein ACOCRO_01645, partial [Halanaerobiales bacterium]